MNYHFSLNKVASALSVAKQQLDPVIAYYYIEEALQVYAALGVAPKQLQALQAEKDLFLHKIGGEAALASHVEVDAVAPKERSRLQKLIGSGTVLESSKLAQNYWSAGHHQDAIRTLQMAILQHKQVFLAGGIDKLEHILSHYSFEYAKILFHKHNALFEQITTTRGIRRDQLQAIEDGLVMAYKLNPASDDIAAKLKRFLHLWEVYDAYEAVHKQLALHQLDEAKASLKQMPMEYDFIRECYEDCCLLEQEIDELYRRAQQVLAKGHFDEAAEYARLIECKHMNFTPLPVLKTNIEEQRQAYQFFVQANQCVDRQRYEEAQQAIDRACALHESDERYGQKQQEIVGLRAQLLYEQAIKAEQAAKIEDALSLFSQTLRLLPYHADAENHLQKLNLLFADLQKAESEATALFAEGALEQALTVLSKAKSCGFSFAALDAAEKRWRQNLQQAQDYYQQALMAQQDAQFAHAYSYAQQAKTLYAQWPAVQQLIRHLEAELHAEKIKQALEAMQTAEPDLEARLRLLCADEHLFLASQEAWVLPASYAKLEQLGLRSDLARESSFYADLQASFLHDKRRLLAFRDSYQEADKLYRQQQEKDVLTDLAAVACYEAVLLHLQQARVHYAASKPLQAYASRLQEQLDQEQAYAALQRLLERKPEPTTMQDLLHHVARLSVCVNPKYQRLLHRLDTQYPHLAELKRLESLLDHSDLSVSRKQISLFHYHHPEATQEYDYIQEKWQHFAIQVLRQRLAQQSCDDALLADLQLLKQSLLAFPQDLETALQKAEQRKQSLQAMCAAIKQAMQTMNWSEAEGLLAQCLQIDAHDDAVLSLQKNLPLYQQAHEDYLEGKRLLAAQQYEEALGAFDQAYSVHRDLPDIQHLYRQAEEGAQLEKVEILQSAAENMIKRDRFEAAIKYLDEALLLARSSAVCHDKIPALVSLQASLALQAQALTGNILIMSSKACFFTVCVGSCFSIARYDSSAKDVPDLPLSLRSLSSKGRQTLVHYDGQTVYLEDQGSRHGTVLRRSGVSSAISQRQAWLDQDVICLGGLAELQLSALSEQGAYLIQLLDPGTALSAEQRRQYWPRLKRELSHQYILMHASCSFVFDTHTGLRPATMSDTSDPCLCLRYDAKKGFSVKSETKDVKRNGVLLEGWQPLCAEDELSFADVRLCVEGL